MKKPLQLKQVLAALLTIAALASGLTAQATVQTGIMMQGQARTVNNQTMCTFVIQSNWGGDQIPVQTGSSYTFSNATMIHGTVDVTLNGTLNFQQGTAMTDVITATSFTVTIESSSLWFYGATVQTKSGANVTGSTVTTSSNHNTLTVTIPQGKTFGAVILDYVSNPPMTNSNTTVTVPQGNYWVSNANHKPKPEPTVVYGGQTILVKDTDYTLSWSNNSSAGTGTVTVTGIGNYAGSATGFFYIRWAIYYVHFDKNHDDATGTMSVQLFTYNTAQALTANTFSRTGYSFIGWSTTSNGAVTYTDGQSVSNLTAEDGQTVTLYAQWVPITYNISYDLAGGSVTTANPTTYNIETATFTLNNPTRTGYTFAGWTGSNGTTPQTTVTINQGSIGDRSFTANWAPITYNISYDLAGGSVATANPTTYNIETATFTLNNPTREHYTFAGWTGTDLDEPTMNVTIAQGSIGDRNYTATWDPIPYNLTYDLAGGSVATANPTTYTVETPTFTLNNPTKVACNFDGWTGSNGDTPETTVTIAQGSTGDRSYTAQWTQYAYPLSLGTDITASGTVAFTYEGTDYFTPGTIITLAYGGTIPEGYRPLYSVNGNAIVGNTFEMPTADVVVDAVLLERYYTFNSTTGVLALLWGEFNRYNKWGSEVIASAVTSVTATDEVSFTGDCSHLFQGFTNCTSMDLTDVNTANVTDMKYMFYGCYGLQSLNISGWNTANVINMSEMFQYCYSLQSLDLSGWNTANVTDMSYIFNRCSGLQLLNISGWNTANVTNMSSMFEDCVGLQSLDLSDWSTANVTNMSSMFENCSGLQSLDLSGWNTANVTTMERMFWGCSSLTTLDLSGWNTANVSDMSQMFYGCSALQSLDLSGWNTANVTYMSDMFYGCSGLPSLDLSGWNTDNVTNMNYMFYGCSGLQSLDVSGWNTDNVTYMNYMFYGCSGLQSLDVSGWNTANVTDMSWMFQQCSSLQSLDLSGWNTAKVTNMSHMFRNCSGLPSLDLSGWNTDKVISMGYMFYGCSDLQSLNVSGWNTAKVAYMAYMFQNCSGLTTIYVGSGWSTSSVGSSNSLNMFRDCASLVGGMGTAYDANHIDKEYARIDGGPDNPGYFTAIPLDPVEYIDADGVAQTLYDYTLLEGSNEFIEYGEYNTEAWYVVAHDVTYSDGFAFRGSANLILVDGATLTVTNVSGNHSNVNCDNGTIYVQSGGTGAIVGENIQIYSYGSMTIHGGHITLSGSNYGLYSTDDITINGGQISIEAQWGCIYAEYDVTINGGVVSTTNQQGGYGICGNNSVTINGGVVTTTNQQGGYGIFSSGVTINGGVVTANAPNGGYGIRTQFSDLLITLGWTNETDRITSDSYYGTVTTVTGKAFTDGEGNYYAGTYYGNEISALAGKTLTPYTNLDEAFHITYVINGGTMPSGYPETYTFDETVTLPVPTKADNTFVGWYKDYYFNYDPITEIAAGTTLGDLTLYASWKPEKTWVDYLDADGQPQRAYATILYGGDEAEYPAGVYTLEEISWGKSYGDVSYNRLNFTGDAILILPDYCSLSIGGERDNDGEDGLFVNGDLTIYGQTLGYSNCFASRIQTSGNVAIYGGYLDIDNLSASNITLGWTGLDNKYSFNQVAGNVTLANDFRLQNDQGTSVVHAGSITSSELEQASLYPYATTIEVSYMDENGDTQTVNATVLWGDETSTSLSGGFYTIMEDVHIGHDLSFNGNTTLIVPLNFFSLNGNLTVDGNLSVYGIGFFSIQDIEATGDVLFCIDDATNPSSTLTASGNVFIAHGCFSAYRIYGSTITLGYLYNNDYIRCGSNYQNGYFGNVVVREGQALQQGGNVYSGTLTAEQISAINGKELKPYIPTIPTLAVTGYGESTESDHWVFIATPIVGFFDPYSVTNLIGGMSPSGQSNFDLYRFNQSAELEWENFYQHLTGGNSFALENGKGYLYANKYDVTLEFNGVVYPLASKEVALDYDANAEFAGWNLVGNPFHAPAILDKSYYKMNSDGTGLVAEAVSGNTAIDAFTGVMVQANGEDETVLFTKSNAKGQQETGFGTLQIALTQTGTRGNALLDNAIVSFNEGDQLGKFYFGTQDANIYIPQGNKEYAIVSVGRDAPWHVSTTTGVNEIPVNFKAHENGEYTITVNPKNVEMGYLHLIDNLTGANVDLLQTPEYVFTAQTADYESRFKLVFSASGDANGDNEEFAFIDASGNIIITDGPSTGSGTCTLQVIDVMGRIVVQGDAMNRVSTSGMTPGVYVLRLINGDTIRTQKIVID